MVHLKTERKQSYHILTAKGQHVPWPNERHNLTLSSRYFRDRKNQLQMLKTFQVGECKIPPGVPCSASKKAWTLMYDVIFPPASYLSKSHRWPRCVTRDWRRDSLGRPLKISILQAKFPTSSLPVSPLFQFSSTMATNRRFYVGKL